MSYDPKSICNLGLGKITASRITQLTPARTALEIKCSEGYAHWRNSELIKRLWVFAWEKNRQLTLSEILPNVPLPYVYAVPNDMLRPLRDKYARWQQVGLFIHADTSTFFLDYIRLAGEHEFHPAFAEVLACRVAEECNEHVTQSNSKGANVKDMYDRAMRSAAKVNAFVREDDDVRLADENSEWLTSRWM